METQTLRHELATQIAQQNRWKERAQLAGLAATAAAIFFVSLGKTALLDWDEALYAEVSKESIRTHHWLTPYWKYHLFLEKPPLSFWIRTAFFHCFGVNEFWARAESALAGIGIVLLTFAIARRTSGARAAFFAGFVLLTTKLFDHAMREAMCDAPLCFCIYLALYGYVRLREGSKSWWYLICAAVGLGMMVNGPAVVIAPAAILIDCLCRRSEEWKIGWREYCLGTLLFAAIVAPWHLWMWFHYGRAFLDEYAGRQVITRTFQPLDNNRGGPFFYLHVIARGAFPWCILAPIAALRWAWQRDWRQRLPWIVVLVTLGLYTLVTTKITHYIIPLYPALAMAVGSLLAELSARRRAMHYAIVAVLAAGVLITFTKFLVFPGFPHTEQVARLAKIAKGSPDHGTLIVIQRDSSPLDISYPTAVFYSDRFAIDLNMPQDTSALAKLTRDRPSTDTILEKDVVPELSGSYRVRPLAEDGDLLYAVISPLSPSAPTTGALGTPLP